VLDDVELGFIVISLGDLLAVLLTKHDVGTIVSADQIERDRGIGNPQIIRISLFSLGIEEPKRSGKCHRAMESSHALKIRGCGNGATQSLCFNLDLSAAQA
jgi:hypothetical protein